MKKVDVAILNQIEDRIEELINSCLEETSFVIRSINKNTISEDTLIKINKETSSKERRMFVLNNIVNFWARTDSFPILN